MNSDKNNNKNHSSFLNGPLLNNMNLSILQDREALSNLVNRAKQIKEHHLQKEKEKENKIESKNENLQEKIPINFAPKSNYVRGVRPLNASRTTKILGQNKKDLFDILKNQKINFEDNNIPKETLQVDLEQNKYEELESNYENLKPLDYSPQKVINPYKRHRGTGSVDFGKNKIKYIHNNNSNYNNINYPYNDNYYNQINEYKEIPQEKIHTNSFYTIKQNSVVKEFSYLEDQNIANEETMEDKGKTIENFNNDNSNILFLLFDGHGGDTVSKYLQKNFDTTYKENLKMYNNDIKQSLKSTFIKLNSEIKKLNLNSVGSTACVVQIKWNSPSNLIIYIANCGDTRASLISPIKFIRLSKDHRADNNEEKERIIKIGGNIINNRIMGVLMLTRAFGDFELENYGVTCEPYINKFEVDLNEKNQFVIVASDGIWDLNSESELQEMIMFNNNSSTLVQNIVKNTLRKDAWDILSIFAIKVT